MHVRVDSFPINEMSYLGILKEGLIVAGDKLWVQGRADSDGDIADPNLPIVYIMRSVQLSTNAKASKEER